MGHARYTTEEIARRAKMLYDQQIRAKVEEADRGKVLVLDIESGDYEIDSDRRAASDRAHARHPNGAFFAIRIGYPAMTKIGGSWSTKRS